MIKLHLPSVKDISLAANGLKSLYSVVKTIILVIRFKVFYKING
jgi:hypothetical protein